MADQETTVPMDDKELFSSAMADEPVQEKPAEQEAMTETERPRDEQGRFVAQDQEGNTPKVETQEEVKTEPQEKPKDEDGQVPSWRLRELREARDAAERRAQDVERNFAVAQEQLRQFHGRLQKFENPPKEPDPFESPKDFLEHGVRQALDPVQSEFAKMREFYSRKDAVREHGEQAVNAAYDALDASLASRDPEAVSTFQRARNSMDPYGDIMKWHSQRTVFSTIGKDPNAWFEKTLEERFKDPAFQAKALERLQGNASQVGSDGRPAIKLPPSLNKIAGGAQNSATDDGDMSDRGLFRQARDSR